MPKDRHFEDAPGIRRQVPLFVSITSPSGGGKTKSALRLATGMQRVTGGDIGGIDTEADRMLHYAPLEGQAVVPGETFKFRHIRFEAPFDPLSYLAAVEHYSKKGIKTFIIDSASHLHEGPGGTLEAHADEVERMSRGDSAKAERVKMLAWQKPKRELRQFLNSILQLRVNIIFCYRAKQKLKMIPGKEPQHLGFMPIAGDEMIYEATINMLLYPNSGGVPSWHPEEMGEKAIIKLPQQFRSMFENEFKGKPLSEDIGQRLAEWAAGGAAPDAVQPQSKRSTLTGLPALRERIATYEKTLGKDLFFSVLGKHGAESVEAIGDEKLAGEIGAELKELAAKK